MILDCKFFNPVAIARTKLDSEIFGKINQLSNNLLSQPPSDYSSSDLTLRGGEQRRVWPGNNVDWLKDYIEIAAREYQKSVCDQAENWEAMDLTPRLKNCWTIKQPQHSYQVTHNHPFGNISGNIYLEVPTFDKASSPTDGCISFLFDNSQDLRMLRLRESLHLPPTVGTMIIFPSWLLHQVYPWKGTGYRRVLAWDCQLLPQ